MNYPKTLVEDEVRHELLEPYLKGCRWPTYVEVGIFLGGNIIRLYDSVYLPHSVFIGVDNFQYSNISKASMEWAAVDTTKPYFDEVMANIQDRNIELINNDSIEAARYFDNGVIDCLFLDGNHEYEYVSKELDAWIPKVKTGGLIVGHDWPERGIQQAVRERFFNGNIKTTTSGGAYSVIC